MLLDAVKAHIESEVPALAGRVEAAAELSALIKNKALPAQLPAAFVLPLGWRPSRPDAAAGKFRQSFADTVAVVLVAETAGDATGAGSLPTVDAIAGDVRDAICGWAPAGAHGVFELSRGALLSLAEGIVIFQIDFALPSQMRIDR